MSSFPGSQSLVCCQVPISGNFIRPEQLVALHKIVRREQAVVLAHRVTDTIKEHKAFRSSQGQDDSRLRTLDRANLWAMETPQVFSRDLIARAYTRVSARGLPITDDAQAVELLGHHVALLENAYPNPKLTTSADLAYLEFLLTSAEHPRFDRAVNSCPPF